MWHAGIYVRGVPSNGHSYRDISSGMLRLVPSAPTPAAPYEPCPIDPDYDRYYVQDEAEPLVHVKAAVHLCAGRGWSALLWVGIYRCCKGARV